MLRTVNRPLDRLAEATSASCDRAVDFLRALAIGVVVIWHWALSVTHRTGGRLVMPNPIDDVPLGWLATWLFQVLPVFFIVGGYANLAAWDSVRRSGGGTGRFLRKRLARLLGPTAVFAVVWMVVEVALRLLVPGYAGVLEVALVVFVPLWFLAAYLWVVLLVPLTAWAHRRGGVLVVVALGAAVALADLGRFAYGLAAFGYLNTALVWVFAHQLGYCWRDGSLRPARRRWALALGGLCALVVITSLDVYPRSLVALQGQERSHMFPTTAGVAALAVFQTGVATLLAPAIARWLRRRGPWMAVIAINSVILTVFLWHMTALRWRCWRWSVRGWSHCPGRWQPGGCSARCGWSCPASSLPCWWRCSPASSCHGAVPTPPGPGRSGHRRALPRVCRSARPQQAACRPAQAAPLAPGGSDRSGRWCPAWATPFAGVWCCAAARVMRSGLCLRPGTCAGGAATSRARATRADRPGREGALAVQAVPGGSGKQAWLCRIMGGVRRGSPVGSWEPGDPCGSRPPLVSAVCSSARSTRPATTGNV